MTSAAVSVVPKRAGRENRRRPGLRAVRASEPSDARARRIVALRESGLTLAEIGREFGVSRQRVQQILDASGARHIQQGEVVAARRAADARRARKQADEILELWRRGERVSQIAAWVGVTQQSIRDTVAALGSDSDRQARAEAGGAPVAGRRAPRFSDEQLCNGLRLVARRLGHTPSKAEYARLSEQHGLARMPTVYSRFGGWRHALRSAGFDVPTDPIRARRWTTALCWRAVVSVHDQLGDPPSYRRYQQLAAVRDDLPSGSTLRLRLGLWPEIVAALRAHLEAIGDAR